MKSNYTFNLTTDEVLKQLLHPALIEYERAQGNRGIGVAWERAEDHYTNLDGTYKLDKSGNHEIGHIFRIACMLPKIEVPANAKTEDIAKLYNQARNAYVTCFFHDVPEDEKATINYLRQKEHTDKRYTVIDYTLDFLTINKSPDDKKFTVQQRNDYYFAQVKKPIDIFRVLDKALSQETLDVKNVISELESLGAKSFSTKVRSLLSKNDLGQERLLVKAKGELRIIRAAAVNYMKEKLCDTYDNLSNIRMENLPESDQKKAVEKYIKTLALLENELKRIAPEHGLTEWFHVDLKQARVEAWANVAKHYELGRVR